MTITSRQTSSSSASTTRPPLAGMYTLGPRLQLMKKTVVATSSPTSSSSTTLASLVESFRHSRGKRALVPELVQEAQATADRRNHGYDLKTLVVVNSNTEQLGSNIVIKTFDVVVNVETALNTQSWQPKQPLPIGTGPAPLLPATIPAATMVDASRAYASEEWNDWFTADMFCHTAHASIASMIGGCDPTIDTNLSLPSPIMPYSIGCVLRGE